MNLLKKERVALVELLTNGREGVETPEDLAQAVADTLDEARAERITYVAVMRHGSGAATFYTGVGPFSTKNQATKALEGLEYTAYAAVPVRSAEGHAELVRQLDARPAPKGDFALVAEDAARFKQGWKGNRKNEKDFPLSRGAWG